MQLTERDFEKLFKEQFVSITIYSRKIVQDTDTAKDLAHRCFIKVWEKRESLPDDSNLKALLYRIARNLSINYIRDQKKFTTDETLPLFESENAQADNDIEASELEAAIVDTIKHMPEKSREVFILSRYQKLTNPKISEKLGISIKTVEAHITSALKILRKKIFGKEKKT
ncbi:MAG: RNA polymerase sigma-70 factor [Bacteroidales bacterium]|nr:RNA polymerase sigma-70 factor [Bacteroidales bacterium]